MLLNSCKHCGEDIYRKTQDVYMSGNHRYLWVHDYGGYTHCFDSFQTGKLLGTKAELDPSTCIHVDFGEITRIEDSFQRYKCWDCDFEWFDQQTGRKWTDENDSTW